MGQASKGDLPDGLSEIFFAEGLDKEANQSVALKGRQVISNCLRVPDASRHEMTRCRAGTYAATMMDPGSAAQHFRIAQHPGKRSH